MRVVQLIDSLDAGGAERMAVNYANSLANTIDFSGLIVTRKEGDLIKEVNDNVHFLCLNRKKRIDIKALWALRHFLKSNNVKIVHAHASSFFMGVLIKLCYFKIKLIWHDHYGGRVQNSLSNNTEIKIASLFFDGVVACNTELTLWAKSSLFVKKVVFIPNFIINNTIINLDSTKLKGVEGKRIVCLSNLRVPKNHQVLVEAFFLSGVMSEGWTLHLIGMDKEDAYSENIKKYIEEKKMNDTVFFYGTQQNISALLAQASIGILASTFEGFPVVLLEYGQQGLPVISTNVGFCPEIIIDNISGLLFNPYDSNELKDLITKMTKDKGLREKFGANLKVYVQQHFSYSKIIQQVIKFYQTV